MKEQRRVVLKSSPKLKFCLDRKANAADIVRKFIIKNMKSRNALVNVAEVYGKIIGYSIILIKDNNAPVFKLKKIGYLGDTFVKKKYRGMKIASLFKEEAFKWFKNKNIKYISLVVYNQNPVHKIYKKWGFVDHYQEMRLKI